MDLVKHNKLLFLALSIAGVQGLFIGTGIYLSYNATRPDAAQLAENIKVAPILGDAGQESSLVDSGSVEGARDGTVSEPIDTGRASFSAEVLPKANSAANDAPAPTQGTVQREYVVQKGDTLTKIWNAVGAPYIGGVNAAKALQAAGVSLGSIRVGDKLQLTVTTDGSDILRLEKRMLAGKRLILEGASKDGYRAEVIAPEVVSSNRTVTGLIRTSFASAASSEGVPFEVVDDLVDLFGSRVDFGRDFQRNDTFTINYHQQQLDDGSIIGTGPIEAASLQLGTRLMVVVRHLGNDGVARYFDERGQPIGNGFLRYPVSFTRISSVFSDSRLHPVLGRVRAHNGVDFAAPVGTPVRAAADGKVVDSGYRGFSGNLVKIQHGARYATAYLHLHRVAPSVRKGSIVRRGDVIGYVGRTGLATGPHLHYSLYVDGRYADPLKTSLPAALVDSRDMIPHGVLEAKLSDIKNHHQVLLAAIAGDVPDRRKA